MIKAFAQFEMIINGKPFRFLCENESSAEDCKEALTEFLSYAHTVGKAQKQAQAAPKQEKHDEKSSSPVESETP